jgi:hypothetical protein
LSRLHGEDKELAGVWFRASPKVEGRRGDRMTAVKRRRRSVRVVLGCGEKGRGVEKGAMLNGVLEGSFLYGRGRGAEVMRAG